MALTMIICERLMQLKVVSYHLAFHTFNPHRLQTCKDRFLSLNDKKDTNLGLTFSLHIMDRIGDDFVCIVQRSLPSQ